MLSIVLLATPALALDCTTSPDADLCAAVENIAASINAQAGTPVIDEAAPNRFDPDTLYQRLDTLRNSIDTPGCDAGWFGWSAGLYTSAGQTWEGAYQDGEIPSAFASGPAPITGGVMAGTIHRADHTVTGTIDASGTLGDRFSGYTRHGKVVANRNANGLTAGHWIRRAGRNGIWVTLHGTCNGVDAPIDVVDPWFNGTITERVAPTTDVTFSGTGDDTFALWVDGVEVSTLPAAASHQWGTLSTNTLTLDSGTHTVAVSVRDTGGSAVMFQFRAEDPEGTVLLSTSTPADWKVLTAAPFAGFESPTYDDSAWATPITCGAPVLYPWLGFTGTGDDYIWGAGGCFGSNLDGLFRGTITLP